MAESVLHLHEKVVNGDSNAVAEVLDALSPRLMALAERVVRNQEGNDAVQSAMRTYLRRVQLGQFSEVQDVQELYRLLATITCRKALKQLRREGKVVPEAKLQAGTGDESAVGMETLAEVMPSQEFDMICDEWLGALDDDSLRNVVLLALHGNSQKEIAEQLGCTTRNVRFKMTRIRQIWEKLLKSSDDEP